MGKTLAFGRVFFLFMEKTCENIEEKECFNFIQRRHKLVMHSKAVQKWGKR